MPQGINLSIELIPNILIDFSLALGFFILITIIIFNAKKSNMFSYVWDNKFKSFLFYFSVGILLGLVFPISYAILELYSGLFLYIPLLSVCAVWVISYFFSRYICMGSFVSFITSIFFFMPYNNKITWLVVLIFILVILNIIIGTYFKTKSYKNFLICLSLNVLTNILIVVWFYIESIYFLLIMIGTMFIACLILFFIIQVINKMYNKLNVLGKNSLYANKYFIHSNFVEEIFKKQINENNVQQATIIIFSFRDLENLLYTKNYKVYKEIHSQLLELLHNYFDGQNFMFIKTQANNFGIITFDKQYTINDTRVIYDGNELQTRLMNDPLQKIENLVCNLPNKIRYNDEVVELTITAFATFYGIHGYDYEQLISNCEQQMQNYSYDKNRSRLQVCNLKNELDWNNDKIHFINLRKAFDIENIKISLDVCTINGQKVLAPVFYYLKSFTSNLKTILKKVPNDLQPTLLRYLAIKSLNVYREIKQKHNYPLMIYYPIQELIYPEFSWYAIENKLSFYDITFNDVIFVFESDMTFLMSDIIIKNLKGLSVFNVKYVLSDIDYEHTPLFKQITPTCITLSENISKNHKLLELTNKLCDKLNINILTFK